jgi:hypothetical protein
MHLITAGLAIYTALCVRELGQTIKKRRRALLLRKLAERNEPRQNPCKH